MSRKQFTTTIDEVLQTKFKEKCSKNKEKMNDVLEVFMKSYINDEFEITRKVKYSLEKK